VFGIPPPEIAAPPHKPVVPPPGDAFRQLIFGKIITIVASRGQILRLKCTKFYFGWTGASPLTPLGELTALSQTP